MCERGVGVSSDELTIHTVSSEVFQFFPEVEGHDILTRYGVVEYIGQDPGRVFTPEADDTRVIGWMTVSDILNSGFACRGAAYFAAFFTALFRNAMDVASLHLARMKQERCGIVVWVAFESSTFFVSDLKSDPRTRKRKVEKDASIVLGRESLKNFHLLERGGREWLERGEFTAKTCR